MFRSFKIGRYFLFKKVNTAMNFKGISQYNIQMEFPSCVLIIVYIITENKGCDLYELLYVIKAMYC